VVDFRVFKQNIYKKIDILLNRCDSPHRNHTVGVYYPADSGKCLRRTFFKYKFGASSDMKGRAKGRILTSTILENLCLDVLQSMGYAIKVKISKRVGEIEIRGEVDAINSEEVVEVKTVTPTAMRKTPFKADLAQLNTYMWLADRQKGAIIYVKSDNPSIIHVCPARFNKDLLDTTITRIQALHEHLKNNKIPPKTDSPNACKNCMFKAICSYIDGLS